MDRSREPRDFIVIEHWEARLDADTSCPGEGSVVGTLIGPLIIALLSNGSDLLGINLYWKQLTIGAVIIVAVSFDEFRTRRLAST